MLDKVSTMKRRALRLLKDDTGSMAPLAALILLCCFLVAGVSLEKWRTNNVADGVNEAVRSSLISANVQTADTLYNGERDMVGGSFVYDAGTNTWTEPVDTSAVTDLLSSRLGLTQSGSDWISEVNGQENYKISGFTVTESQPSATDGTPDATKGLTLTASFTLEIPFNAAGTITKITVPMHVSAGTQGKF